MSIVIAEYVFEGPYGDTHTLKDMPGIFAIQCYKDEKYYPIDVGESDAVRWRVENHERKYFWNYHCHGRLKVAVLYTPKLQQEHRIKVVRLIRSKYQHPCEDY